MARPVAFSVLVIAVILVPLYALQGVEGKMFAPLASTMLIALLVSLAVALLVIPVLSELVLKQVPEKEFGFIRRFHAGYRALLDRAIARPKRTIGISVAVLVVAGALTPLVGTEFMPALDEGAIAINVVRLPNASLQGSVEVSRYLEKRLKTYPEVETVVSKTGRAEISEDPMGPEQTDVFVMLKPRRTFGGGRSRAELAPGHAARPGTDARSSLLLLPAHRAARERAHLRGEERPRRESLRDRPALPQGLRRTGSRSPSEASGEPRT